VVVLGVLGIEAVWLECAGGPLEQAASISPSAEQQTNGQCQVALHLILFADMNSPPFDPGCVKTLEAAIVAQQRD